MIIRSLASVLIFASSFVLVTAQTPDARKADADKAAKTSTGMGTAKLRDLPFPSGVSLEFLIKELARDIDLNVLFDPDSFRFPGRKTFIDLRNVTVREALDYIFLQEGLFFEEAGSRTILVATRFQGRSIPQIGVGLLLPMSDQLAGYFGVAGGLLINTVGDNSPASKAGLRAGDVIVEIDGVAAKGSLGAIRSINDKNESEINLTIVRDRKRQTISVTPQKGIGSVANPR